MNFKHFYDAGLQGTGAYKFRHYSASEPSSGETWVLNDTLTSVTANFSVNFTSNNTQFVRMNRRDENMQYFTTDGPRIVYNNEAGWTPDVYKTVTFSTSPTGDLLTWLQANGTKQGGGGAVTGYDVTVTGTTKGKIGINCGLYLAINQVPADWATGYDAYMPGSQNAALLPQTSTVLSNVSKIFVRPAGTPPVYSADVNVNGKKYNLTSAAVWYTDGTKVSDGILLELDITEDSTIVLTSRYDND